MKYACCLLMVILTLVGCTSKRSGYAVDAYNPPLGMTYREVIAHLGNPTTVKPLKDGMEAIWIGSATSGGSCHISFSYVRWVSFGKVHTETLGRRLCFDGKGQLFASFPIGEGDPAWGLSPF